MDVYQIFPSYLCVKKFKLDNQIQILQNIKNIHEEFVKSDTINVETVYSQNASASLVDEEDFNTKISKGSKPAKKRTLSKANKKKMMEGKTKKN